MKRIAIRLAAFFAGGGIMYWEGQNNPNPGIGFAVALGLWGFALMWGADKPLHICVKCGQVYSPLAESQLCVGCWWDAQDED